MSSENSRKTELQLIRAVQSGDSEAFMELAQRYLPLIHSKAVSFSVLEADDLYQEGLVALLSAAKMYDPKQQVNFYTYAGVCISNRLLSVVRILAAKKQIPTQCLISLSDEKNCGIQNITSQNVSNPETLVIERENFEAVRKQLKQSLTKLEQDVFFLYLSGYRYTEIAENLRLSGKTVDNALQRARQKLRRLF